MAEPKWVISRARGAWEAGARSVIHARQFPIVVDEPESFGGTNQGPRPTEYLLAAFCGCTVVIAERCAQELGMHLTSMTVEARGSLDQRGVTGEAVVTPCFQLVEGRVSVGLEVGGPEAMTQLRQLVEQRCPLHNTLVRSGASVTMDWTLVR